MFQAPNEHNLVFWQISWSKTSPFTGIIQQSLAFFFASRCDDQIQSNKAVELVWAFLKVVRHLRVVAIQVVYLGHLPGGCSQPQTCWFLACVPFGLHRLPWHKSMLVTMVTGVKSGHLARPSDAAHSYTPHIVRICLLAQRTFRCACVWWFGGHAWWSSGSLRPDYRPTDQLADHMDRNLHSALCLLSLLWLPHMHK